MTRQDMRVRIAQLLGLKIGDGLYGDPFSMDNALNRVCDEFAGPGMDCYWVSETSDIVANQAEYSAPNMYKLLGAYWLDSTGAWRPLLPTTPQALDSISWYWRNDPASSYPVYIAFEGPSRYVIFPTPNYNMSGGLKFEGYASTNASGISTWAADSTTCPLPSWCHEAIVYGAAIDTAQSMLASDTPADAVKAQRLLPILEARYRKLRGQAEAAASTFYQDVVKVRLNANWLGWIYSR